MSHSIRSICIVVCLVACAGFCVAAPSQPYESFRVKTDNTPQAEISGWILPATGKARGTVFVCHGYGNSKHSMVGYQWMRDEGWNLVMFDFREHGDSTRTSDLSSLGYHEIWDLKAVIDHAETKQLSKPYCIYGRSLGASVGLRWASQDRRIVGVLAASPFNNAYDASQKVTSMKSRVDWPMSPFVLHRGFVAMLKEVDIPKAVSKRDDLKIWIIAGEHDCFTLSDQEAILSASASPETYKHLLIAPGKGHTDTYLWKGNWRLPSHDDYVRQFLADCEGRRSAAMIWIPGIEKSVSLRGLSPWVVAGALFLLIFIYRRMRARWRRALVTSPGNPGEG